MQLIDNLLLLIHRFTIVYHEAKNYSIPNYIGIVWKTY